jgi:hypothetical protein
LTKVSLTDIKVTFVYAEIVYAEIMAIFLLIGGRKKRRNGKLFWIITKV